MSIYNGLLLLLECQPMDGADYDTDSDDYSDNDEDYGDEGRVYKDMCREGIIEE
jgi:hypothetical protein